MTRFVCQKSVAVAAGVAGIVLAGFLSAGCRPGADSTTPPPSATSTNPVIYQVKGVIHDVIREKRKVKIAHEEIPGYMEAMTMLLDVRDVKELDGIKPGDSVSFRMLVTDDDGWIDEIKVLASGPTNAPAAPAGDPFVALRNVEPVEVGAPWPEFRFTNQLGKVVQNGDFQGQAVALTFIFTRCPFPTFCPRMSMNFSQVHEQLKAQQGGITNWHLLSITMDPEFDTPAKLKAYAQGYKYDPAHWSFLVGSVPETLAFGDRFTLQFWQDKGTISHNLRTVVVDRRGKIQKILIENEWKPDELVSELVKAAKVP